MISAIFTTVALLASTATAQGVVNFGDACTTAATLSCGPTNTENQGSIAICQGGVFVKLDDCNDSPNNACTYLGGTPFCVLGNGFIGASKAATGGATTIPGAGTVVTVNKVTMGATAATQAGSGNHTPADCQTVNQFLCQTQCGKVMIQCTGVGTGVALEALDEAAAVCNNGAIDFITNCVNGAPASGQATAPVPAPTPAPVSTPAPAPAPQASMKNTTPATGGACTGVLYTIKSGDLCDTIAQNNGATVSDLVFVNQDICGGENQNNLQVGQQVCVVPHVADNAGPTITADTANAAAYAAANPSGPCAAGGSGHVDLVMTGATCAAIAAKYGITLDALIAATSPGQCGGLEAADAICIPTAGKGAAPAPAPQPVTNSGAAPMAPVAKAPVMNTNAGAAGTATDRAIKSSVQASNCANGKLQVSLDMSINPMPAAENGLAAYTGQFFLNGTPVNILSSSPYVFKPTVQGASFAFSEMDDQPSVGFGSVTLDVPCNGQPSTAGLKLQFAASNLALPNGETASVNLSQTSNL
ncbi:hypothetical protein BC830DRAFT_1150952 [Chytriomyces sp. MP71]|nr:hypothetical protein BC830DRAFT_1150952 [Chytriomyces sp. MP71]